MADFRIPTVDFEPMEEGTFYDMQINKDNALALIKQEVGNPKLYKNNIGEDFIFSEDNKLSIKDNVPLIVKSLDDLASYFVDDEVVPKYIISNKIIYFDNDLYNIDVTKNGFEFKNCIIIGNKTTITVKSNTIGNALVSLINSNLYQLRINCVSTKIAIQTDGNCCLKGVEVITPNSCLIVGSGSCYANGCKFTSNSTLANIIAIGNSVNLCGCSFENYKTAISLRTNISDQKIIITNCYFKEPVNTNMFVCSNFIGTLIFNNNIFSGDYNHFFSNNNIQPDEVYYNNNSKKGSSVKIIISPDQYGSKYGLVLRKIWDRTSLTIDDTITETLVVVDSSVKRILGGRINYTIADAEISTEKDMHVSYVKSITNKTISITHQSESKLIEGYVDYVLE